MGLHLLRWIVVALSLALTVAMLVLLAHGSVETARRRWLLPRIEAARTELVHLVLADDDETRSPEVGSRLPALVSLPPQQATTVMLGLMESLTGEARADLAYVAEQLGLMARARRQVLGRWRGRYLLGVRFLVAAGQGSELIPELARSPRPYVRARAAEWSVDYPTPAVIVALLGLLDDPDPMCAFCAKDALSRMGRVAVTPLNGYLRTASGTRALAGLQVAAGLHDGDLASAATRFATDEQWAVRAAAAEVLGASADDDSVAALLRLLDDDHPAVRAAAVGALGGLQHWPASRDLVRLTTDDDWSVRVAAGRSLVDLGAAGQLLLEHVARQGGQAGDMASRLLSASLL